MQAAQGSPGDRSASEGSTQRADSQIKASLGEVITSHAFSQPPAQVPTQAPEQALPQSPELALSQGPQPAPEQALPQCPDRTSTHPPEQDLPHASEQALPQASTLGSVCSDIRSNAGMKPFMHDTERNSKSGVFGRSAPGMPAAIDWPRTIVGNLPAACLVFAGAWHKTSSREA